MLCQSQAIVHTLGKKTPFCWEEGVPNVVSGTVPLDIPLAASKIQSLHKNNLYRKIHRSQLRRPYPTSPTPITAHNNHTLPPL